MPLPLLLIPAAAAASAATGVSVGTLIAAIISSIVGGASVTAASIAAFFHFKKGDAATALAHQESLLKQQRLIENRKKAVHDSLNTVNTAVRTAADELYETSESFSSAARSFSDEAKALDETGAALQSSIELAAKATSQTQEQSESWNQMQAQLRASEESMSSVSDILSDTQDSLGSNEQDIQRLNDELASQAQVVATLNETIRTLTDQYNASDADNTRLLERNQGLVEKSTALLSKIDEVQSVFVQAVEQYNRLKARYLDVVAQNVALQQELSQKQEEIDVLISAHASPLTSLGLHRRMPESGNQGAPDLTQAPRPAH